MYCGRIDTQVKIHGYRMSSSIESYLSQCDGVEWAPARWQGTGADSSSSPSSSLKGRTLDGEKLQEELRRKLPPSMVPAHFAVFSALPVTCRASLIARCSPTSRSGFSATARLSRRAQPRGAHRPGDCTRLPGMDEISFTTTSSARWHLDHRGAG